VAVVDTVAGSSSKEMRVQVREKLLLAAREKPSVAGTEGAVWSKERHRLHLVQLRRRRGRPADAGEKEPTANLVDRPVLLKGSKAKARRDEADQEAKRRPRLHLHRSK
jgi:hypothetical protein